MDKPHHCLDKAYHITSHYNNSTHNALGGLSPTTLDHNLDPEQLTQDIHSILEQAKISYLFCPEAKNPRKIPFKSASHFSSKIRGYLH